MQKAIANNVVQEDGIRYHYELSEPCRSPSEHCYFDERVTDHYSRPEWDKLGVSGMTKNLIATSCAPFLSNTIHNHYGGAVYLPMQDPRTAAVPCLDVARIGNEVRFYSGPPSGCYETEGTKEMDSDPISSEFEFGVSTNRSHCGLDHHVDNLGLVPNASLEVLNVDDNYDYEAKNKKTPVGRPSLCGQRSRPNKSPAKAQKGRNRVFWMLFAIIIGCLVLTYTPTNRPQADHQEAFEGLTAWHTETEMPDAPVDLRRVTPTSSTLSEQAFFNPELQLAKQKSPYAETGSLNSTYGSKIDPQDECRGRQYTLPEEQPQLCHDRDCLAPCKPPTTQTTQSVDLGRDKVQDTSVVCARTTFHTLFDNLPGLCLLQSISQLEQCGPLACTSPDSSTKLKTATDSSTPVRGANKEFEAHLQLSATPNWLQASTMPVVGAAMALNSSKIASWTEFCQSAVKLFKLLALILRLISVDFCCKTEPSGFGQDASGSFWAMTKSKLSIPAFESRTLLGAVPLKNHASGKSKVHAAASNDQAHIIFGSCAFIQMTQLLQIPDLADFNGLTESTFFKWEVFKTKVGSETQSQSNLFMTSNCQVFDPQQPLNYWQEQSADYPIEPSFGPYTELALIPVTHEAQPTHEAMSQSQEPSFARVNHEIEGSQDIQLLPDSTFQKKSSLDWALPRFQMILEAPVVLRKLIDQANEEPEYSQGLASGALIAFMILALVAIVAKHLSRITLWALLNVQAVSGSPICEIKDSSYLTRVRRACCQDCSDSEDTACVRVQLTSKQEARSGTVSYWKNPNLAARKTSLEKSEGRNIEVNRKTDLPSGCIDTSCGERSTAMRTPQRIAINCGGIREQTPDDFLIHVRHQGHALSACEDLTGSAGAQATLQPKTGRLLAARRRPGRCLVKSEGGMIPILKALLYLTLPSLIRASVQPTCPLTDEINELVNQYADKSVCQLPDFLSFQSDSGQTVCVLPECTVYPQLESNLGNLDDVTRNLMPFCYPEIADQPRIASWFDTCPDYQSDCSSNWNQELLSGLPVEENTEPLKLTQMMSSELPFRKSKSVSHDNDSDQSLHCMQQQHTSTNYSRTPTSETQQSRGEELDILTLQEILSKSQLQGLLIRLVCLMLTAIVIKVSISWSSIRWTQRHSKMVGVIMLVFYAHAGFIDFMNSMPIANKPSHTNFRMISIGLLVCATSAIAALIVCKGIYYRQPKPRSNAIERLLASKSGRNSTNWVQTRWNQSSFLRCNSQESMIAQVSTRQNRPRGEKLRQKQGNRSFFFLLVLCANTCLANLSRISGVTGTQDSVFPGWSDWTSVIDNNFSTWQYDGNRLWGNGPTLSTIHTYVTIIFPNPVLVRTIFLVNNEQSDYDNHLRLAGSEFRVGFDTDPWLNPDCGAAPTMSGVYFCNQPNGLVGTRLSLYKYVPYPTIGEKFINIGEIRAYSYIPVGYPDSPVGYTFHTKYQGNWWCKDADPLRFYGLNPKSLTTAQCYNENYVSGDSTTEERDLYFYVRLSNTRHIHAVTILTNPSWSYGDSNYWALTVGYGTGDSIKTNPQYGVWSSARKEGQEFHVDAPGRVVGVYRYYYNGGCCSEWFSLRWIGIISTAIDCGSGTFDWSGGKQDWPAQVYVQPSSFTITGVIAATMSDCAVYHYTTPTMSDGSALPSWITASGTTVTITISTTTPRGSYTIRQNAYLNDYISGYRPAVKDITFRVINCLTTVLNLPSAMVDFSIVVDGAAYSQTFMPATDSEATFHGISSACGPRVYTIVETIPDAFTTITAPAVGQEYTSPWTLTAQANCTHVGTHTVTLRVTLQNYTGVTAATQSMTATVITNSCCSTIINTQTLAAPSTYQITFAGTASTVLSFPMNTDSVGVIAINPMQCGTKTYSTGEAWLSVLTPADPATQQFQLRAATSDYTLATTHTINLVIGFVNTLYTATLTQTFNLTLLHPCKQTTITTAQTIGTINFNFGATAVLTSFTNFSDSVATAYSIAGLCGLTYSISLAADATTYGVSIVPGSPNKIRVLTNTALNKGTFKSFTLSANATPQQDSASQTVTFTVNIVDTCPSTTLSLGTQTLTTMTSKVTDTASTQTFLAPTDSLSTDTGISNLCGDFTYSVNTEAQPFVTINQTTRVLTLQSDDMTKIGTYTVTLSAKLTSYTAVTAATKTFTVTLVDPCLTADLTLGSIPTIISEVTSAATTHAFTAATNSASTLAGVTNLCGSYTYSIIQNYSFVTINQLTHVLTIQSNNMAQIGQYSPTLSASLTSYPARPAATQTFTIVLQDPCLSTVLTLPTTLTDFTIVPHSGVPYTQTFMPATDSKADAAGILSLCGPRVYAIVEPIPALLTTIVPPSAGQEFTSAWTLSKISNNCADSGVWTFTLRATLLNYPEVAPVTKVITATVYNQCCATSINPQTLASSLTYQITYSTAPTVLMSFMMNSDSTGVATGDPLICGAKKYSTGKTWLTVTTPADPVTQQFKLVISTNDYSIASTYTINLVVSFVNDKWTGTLTQTFTLTLIHPCKLTTITTSQTISPITYPFGGAPVLQSFINFTDSISTQYGVPGLCQLVYKLTLQAEAIAYGVSVIPGTPSSQIRVQTNVAGQKGKSISLTLSANTTPQQQDTPSQTLTFWVNIQDTCPQTILSFGSWLPTSMTSKVTQAAAIQTFQAPIDSLSETTGIPNLCGGFTYSITQGYSFLTINQTTRIITLKSTNMAQVGSYIATFSASLTDYPLASSASISFSVVLVDPCLTTTLNLPTSLQSFTITSFTKVGFTQAFMPATDSAAIQAETPSLCGPRVYTILETQPRNFMKMIQPAGDLFTTAWTLEAMSNDLADAGVWTFTLQATLQNYPIIAPAKQVITGATVIDACSQTQIRLQSLSDLSSVVLGPATTQTFMAATDSKSDSYGQANVCGRFVYSISHTTFLSLDALSMVITLSSNDMAAIGVYTATLTATLTLYPAVPAATSSFRAILVDPCLLTSIPSFTLPTMTIVLNQAEVTQSLSSFFVNSVATAQSMPGLCGTNYAVTFSPDKPFLTYQAPTLKGRNTNNTQLGIFSIEVTIALGNYCSTSTTWTVITTCTMQPPVVPLQSVIIKIGKDSLPYLIPFTQPDSVRSCGQTATITSLPPNLEAEAFVSLTPNLPSGGSIRVENLTLNEANTYTITLTNVIPGVGTQLTTGIEVIIADACIDALFETQPNPITQMRAVLASAVILEQSFKIYTDLERLVASSSCPVTAEVVPSLNFISVNNSNTEILVDTAILTQLIPASVKTHSFVLRVKSTRYPTVVPQANYSFELLVTCVTTSIQLVSSSLTDISYEVDPIAPGPMSLPLPVYRCLPCLESTTYTRTLVMEQTPHEPLSSFMTTADATGAIRVAITNPWDTGKYSYQVVARETNGPADGPSNNQVTFNLTLTCTVKRFFNREKSLTNIVFTIPSSLISPVDKYVMPVYATEPTYCQLYEIESSLVYESTSDLPADFVKIDNSVKPARLLVQENDPAKAGVYSFYIRATEPSTKFIDQSVRFQIKIVCLIEQFAPVLNEKTVYEMSYLIRSGASQFNLPTYTWKPKTCLKEVKYKLVMDGKPDAKFPPFIKVNLDNLVVDLNGGRDQYEFANQEFRFRMIAETTDNQNKNSDYSFLIRTQFKNTAPKFMDPLQTQQFFVGLKYEVLLPEMIDDDGDEIRKFSIAPKPSWLQLRRDPNKDSQLRIIADLRLLTKADVGNSDFKITLTDEFGASRVIKQTVWVMYDANQLPVIQQAPTVTSTNSTTSSVTKQNSAQASNATSSATNATDSSAASNSTDVINGTADALNITDDGSNTTAASTNSTEECPAGNNTDLNATECATNTTELEEASNSTATNETNSNDSKNMTTEAVADYAPNVASTGSPSSQNKKDEVKDQTITFEAVQVSVPNLATQYLPPFKAKPSWEKPKFNTTADENAEPQVFSQLVEGRCAVKLSFSQPMDFSKIQKPDEIFEVKITVYLEKASRYLRRQDEFSSYLAENDMSSRELSLVDVTEDAGSINYSWVLEQLSPTDAEFSIELQDPYSISVGDTIHVLQIRQKGGNIIFRSYKGVPMTTLNIEFKLPAQIAPADQNTTSNFNAITGQTSITAMLGTLIVAILAGQSLNMLFSMIGSLQFSLYLSVLNTNFPGNANEVFKKLMEIMQFDFIPDFIMSPFYELVSSRTNDDDISQRFNQRFDQMGYKTSNWVVNLGSNSLFIGIIIAQMLVLPIFRGILFALRCQRKLRLKIKEYESSLYWNQPTRLILELFFELALISAIRLQIHEVDTEFEQAFTYTAIALLCFLVFFAWYIAHTLIHIRRFTHEEEIEAKYGTLFEGLNHENRIGFMNTPFFCLCRLIFIIFVIFYQEYVTFQVMMISLVAFVQVWFATGMPYKRKLTNILELMNQICTYIITVFCFSLTDQVPHAHIRYKFGWAIIGIIGFFIAVNIVVQTFDIFKSLITQSKSLYQKCRKRRTKAEQKKATDKQQTKQEAEVPNTTQIVTSTEQLVVQHTNLKPIKQQVNEDIVNESEAKELSELENSKGFMLDIHFDQSKLFLRRNQMLTSYAKKTEMRPLNFHVDGVEVDEESLNVLNDAVLHAPSKKNGVRRLSDELENIEEEKESSSSFNYDDDLKKQEDPLSFHNMAVNRLTISEIMRLYNQQRQMDNDLKTERKIVKPVGLMIEDISDDV